MAATKYAKLGERARAARAAAGCAPAAPGDTVLGTAMGDGRDAVFLMTPHVSLLSALAVFEVLRAANRLSGRELYVLRFASADGTAVTAIIRASRRIVSPFATLC